MFYIYTLWKVQSVRKIVFHSAGFELFRRSVFLKSIQNLYRNHGTADNDGKRILR